METRQSRNHETRNSVTLRSMRAGDVGLVTALHSCGAAARRLAEFGLIRGTMVEVIRSGSPCIVRIDHTRLSMGASLQEGVDLSPLD